MDTIKELVCDEGNAVTCRRFDVALLDKFYKEEKAADLHKSLFVSGSLKNGHRIATVVTSPPDDLPLDNILSEHTYSVGKKAHPSGLLPVEFDSKNKARKMIKCKSIVSRKGDDVDKLRFKDGVLSKPNVTSGNDTKDVKTETVVKKVETTDKVTSSNAVNVKKPTSQKSGNMASFFAQKPKDSAQKSESKPVVETKKVEESPKATNKSLELKNTQSKKAEESKSSVAKENLQKSPVASKKPQNVRTYEKKKPTPKSSKKSEKRKRIRTIESDDSESDDPFASSPEDNANSDDENVIPPTPQPEKPKIRVVMKTVKKDKVFMGDDDYIHTVKNVCENVTEIETTTYESEAKAKSPAKASEKEKAKPPESKKSKKTSPKNNGSGKQGNIMSYFSKK